jgi:hypothetical protein
MLRPVRSVWSPSVSRLLLPVSKSKISLSHGCCENILAIMPSARPGFLTFPFSQVRKNDAAGLRTFASLHVHFHAAVEQCLKLIKPVASTLVVSLLSEAWADPLVGRHVQKGAVKSQRRNTPWGHSLPPPFGQNFYNATRRGRLASSLCFKIQRHGRNVLGRKLAFRKCIFIDDVRDIPMVAMHTRFNGGSRESESSP